MWTLKRQSSTFLSLHVRLRWTYRQIFKLLKALVFSFFKLWIRRVYDNHNIPTHGPALIVANHASYYDFLILGSLIGRPLVFVAMGGLAKRPVVSWFTKFDTVVYIDRDHPGFAAMREIMRHLTEGKIVVIFPEGTRSRSGKMLKPKTGFIKLAIKSTAPIIPIGLKGTFDILPPTNHIPRFKRCEVFICQKYFISPQNEIFQDVFNLSCRRGRFDKLQRRHLQIIANRIMDQIRQQIKIEWEEPSAIELNLPDERNTLNVTTQKK